MILIPGGEFAIGSNDYDDEKPIHKVYLDAYYIDKYEVTVGQFRKFVEATGYKTEDERKGRGFIWKELTWRSPYFSESDSQPVVHVSWNDAKAYCEWVGRRLPTEAEWEKAARGTDGRSYPWGYTWDANKCNSDEDSRPVDYVITAPVGSFPQGASPYGVMDMAGNVSEWCQDWYDEKYYQSSPKSNSKGPSSGSSHVQRGGSWDCDQDFCRSTARDFYDPRVYLFNAGFRCARDAK